MHPRQLSRGEGRGRTDLFSCWSYAQLAPAHKLIIESRYRLESFLRRRMHRENARPPDQLPARLEWKDNKRTS
jgi:hypothetical protein